MFENLPKYVAGAKIGIKSSVVYRADWVLFVAFQIVSPLIMIFVWTAVFTHSGVSSIGGFQLDALYAYFFVVGAAAGISALRVQDVMENDILGGDIAIAFTRPLGYIAQVVNADLASKLFAGFVISLPVLVLINIFIDLHLTVATVLLFLLELVVAYVIATLIGIFLGSLAVHFTDIGGVADVTQGAGFLLGGAIMPLSMFPSIFISVASFLPFRYLFYVPAATLVGAISNAQAIGTLPLAAAWILVFLACDLLLWRWARRRINAVGV